mmetsp:Transcript_1030/g.2010  ORF Transcript_1030/g.2010 Transcript_1030/m.2010 type:complete len:241 (-) Transcript_1030:89-811(-)
MTTAADDDDDAPPLIRELTGGGQLDTGKLKRITKNPFVVNDGVIPSKHLTRSHLALIEKKNQKENQNACKNATPVAKRKIDVDPDVMIVNKPKKPKTKAKRMRKVASKDNDRIVMKSAEIEPHEEHLKTAQSTHIPSFIATDDETANQKKVDGHECAATKPDSPKETTKPIMNMENCTSSQNQRNVDVKKTVQQNENNASPAATAGNCAKLVFAGLALLVIVSGYKFREPIARKIRLLTQ